MSAVLKPLPPCLLSPLASTLACLQAVVVSIDPKRVYVADPSATTHTCVKAATPGPAGEQWCWWQCTVKGGREGRDVDAVQLAKVGGRERGCWCQLSACLCVLPGSSAI